MTTVSPGRPGSHSRSSYWRADARVTVVGLALVAPIVVAMMVGSGTVVLLASVILLAASLLSPVTGLVALAFMAPFPRPLEIPAPGLYVAIIGAIFLGTLFRLPIERPRLSWPPLDVSLVGAFLLYVAASLLAGPLDGPWSDRASAISSLFAVFMTGVLTYIAARSVLRGRSPYPVLAAMLVSAVLASAIALSQSSGAEGLFGVLAVQGDVPNRVTGPFADPNYFGAYLAAATTLGVACAVIARSRKLKIAILALSAVAGVTLVLTLSRGALVALIAGLTTLAFTRGRKVGLAAVATILLVGVVAWPLFAEQRYGSSSGLAGAGVSSQLEDSGRTGAWLAGLEVFQSSPLIGIGWGRFVEEASSGIAAHNWYIAVLAETGIVGFLLWMLFIVASVLALRTKPRAAQTVGYSVLATWMVAALFIEVPVVYGSAGLVLIVLAAAIASDWTPRGRAKTKCPRGEILAW